MRKRTTKQHKNKRKRERKLAKKRGDSVKQAIPKAGDVLNYITHLNPKNKRHQQYFFQIVARVSTEGQRNHLIPQLGRLHCYADIYNLRVLPKDFRVVASLIQLDEFELETSESLKLISESQYGWLADIAGRMLPLKTYFPDMKFALLFESSCRVVRSDNYKENRDAPITEEKLKEVVEIAHFPIFTMYPPDASQPEIASYRANFELLLKEHRESLGIKSPKPAKCPGDLKREYDEKHNKSIELQLEDKSHRYIAELLDVPIERIRSWWLKSPKYYPKN